MSQVDNVHKACADERCAPAPLVTPTKAAIDRAALVREAFRLEWLTIAWMTVEAVVAIAAAISAGSLALMAFGLDSVIELASAGVLMWRLSVELRHGEQFSERAERRASRIGGALLFALAAYVTVAALWSLWTRSGQEFSWPGFVVALVAIPAMRYLAHRKIVIAESIGSRALRADAMEAVTCGWLSFVVVASLAAQGHGGMVDRSPSSGSCSRKAAKPGPAKSAAAPSEQRASDANGGPDRERPSHRQTPGPVGREREACALRPPEGFQGGLIRFDTVATPPASHRAIRPRRARIFCMAASNSVPAARARIPG
jgi:hypothetical protein